MSVPNPATIYYCPECGETFERQVQTTVPHRDRLDRHRPQVMCPGQPVERLLVDPATTREGWLIDYAEPGTGYTDWGVDMVPPSVPADYPHRRVLVFDAPKETINEGKG